MYSFIILVKLSPILICPAALSSVSRLVDILFVVSFILVRNIFGLVTVVAVWTDLVPLLGWDLSLIDKVCCVMGDVIAIYRGGWHFLAKK